MSPLSNISDSFIIIPSNWPIAKIKEILFGSVHKYAVLHDERKDISGNWLDDYYLFKKDFLNFRLSNLEDQVSIYDGVDLANTQKDIVIESYENPPHNTPALVVDDSKILGVLEVGSEPRAIANEAKNIQSLVTTFPQQVELNKEASLTVEVSSLSSNGETAVDVSGFPLGTNILVIIRPEQGFEVIGEHEKTFVLEEDARPLLFSLKPTQLGKGRIKILIFADGQGLKPIKLTSEILQQATTQETHSSSQPVSFTPVPSPDLQVVIYEEYSQGRFGFSLRLRSTDPLLDLWETKFGPIYLHRDATSYFENLFSDFKHVSRRPEDRDIVIQELGNLGANLFDDLFPDEPSILPLRRILWEHRDRISSILITSETPYMPWELCRLRWKDDNGTTQTDDRFFCERFVVTRWVIGKSPQLDLELSKMGLIVPQNSRLSSASLERDFLVNDLNCETIVVENINATVAKVQKAMESEEYSLWHFTGHGDAREDDVDRSKITLEDLDIKPYFLKGVQKHLERTKPFVFFNACETAAPGYSLTGIGGWAKHFIDAGASGYLGTYWPVNDDMAFKFAEAFYTNLCHENLSVAEAVKEARKTVKELNPQNPTWLAYSLYAHPLAKMRS